MSNTPGISPITPDIEGIRHSDADDPDLIGGEDEVAGDTAGGAGEETGEHGAAPDRPAKNPG